MNIRATQQTNKLTQSNTQVTFRGLRENLSLGNKVIEEFKKEFKGLESNTHLQMDINKLKRNNAPEKKWLPLQKKADKIAQKVLKVRRNIRSTSLYGSLDEYAAEISKLMQKHKAGNCSEIGSVVLFKLFQKGKHPKRMKIQLLEKDTNKPVEWGNHVFDIFGIKKDSLPMNPDTWGDEAVSVDPWKGDKAMKANEALNGYLDMLAFDEQKHNLRITDTTHQLPPFSMLNW